MISRCTSSVPKEVAISPRLLYCDSTCSQTCRRRSLDCHWRSQVVPKFSLALRGVLIIITITPMVLLYKSSEIPVTLKACRNALLGSDTRLKLMNLSLHSTSSLTLLQSSSDWNIFCWGTWAVAATYLFQDLVCARLKCYGISKN